MAWGTKQAATQLTTITTTEQFFNLTPNLLPGETVAVQVTCTHAGNRPIFAIYAALGDTTWDNTPFMEFELPTTLTPARASVLVSGIERFRVGVRAFSGTLTNANCDHMKDGVSL